MASCSCVLLMKLQIFQILEHKAVGRGKGNSDQIRMWREVKKIRREGWGRVQVEVWKLGGDRLRWG